MALRILFAETQAYYEGLLQDETLSRYLRLLDNYHRETYQHSLRVGRLSVDLGLENSLPGSDLYPLGAAGLLHDIGKTQVSNQAVEKRGALDAFERKMVKRHVRLGFMALHPIGVQAIREIVAAHHEFKSDPYPRNGVDRRAAARSAPERRRVKARVRKMAQIVAIADMADALVNARAYKEALPMQQVEALLRQDFTGDPVLIDQVLAHGNARQ